VTGAPPAIADGSFEGVDAVVLSAGNYTATFLPELGLLGSSLTCDGHEYVSLHGGVDAYRGHHTTGMPILHPWANRLAHFRYEFAGTWVDFDAAPPVNTHGELPIHGTMLAASGWRVEAQLADSTRATLQARYVFGDDPARLASFPFPHDLVVFVELSDLGMRVTTTVHATGSLDVPISFGWHPYFQLPSVARRDLAVVLPDREHLVLDGQMLPTGEAKAEPASVTWLGDGALEKTFDDSYRLGEGSAARTLAIEGPAVEGDGLQRLEVELDDSYPYAQVYAPSNQIYVALEPMTAPPNALVSGEHRVVPAGESASASYVVRVVQLAEPEGSDGPVPDPPADD
jgi:galactose mutarotase-like enzyme